MNVLDWMNVKDIEPYKASLLSPDPPKRGEVKAALNLNVYEGDLVRYLLSSHGLQIPPDKQKGNGKGKEKGEGEEEKK